MLGGCCFPPGSSCSWFVPLPVRSAIRALMTPVKTPNPRKNPKNIGYPEEHPTKAPKIWRSRRFSGSINWRFFAGSAREAHRTGVEWTALYFTNFTIEHPLIILVLVVWSLRLPILIFNLEQVDGPVPRHGVWCRDEPNQSNAASRGSSGWLLLLRRTGWLTHTHPPPPAPPSP